MYFALIIVTEMSFIWFHADYYLLNGTHCIQSFHRDSRLCDDYIYNVAVEMINGMKICMRNGYKKDCYLIFLHCIAVFFLLTMYRVSHIKITQNSITCFIIIFSQNREICTKGLFPSFSSHIFCLSWLSELGRTSLDPACTIQQLLQLVS